MSPASLKTGPRKAARLPGQVKGNGAGDGCIERVDLASHGELQEEITRITHQRAHTLPFIADNQSQWAVQPDLPRGIYFDLPGLTIRTPFQTGDPDVPFL